MNKYLLSATLTFLTSFTLFAQDDEIEAPLQYPFGETGVDVPRGVFGSDDRCWSCVGRNKRRQKTETRG